MAVVQNTYTGNGSTVLYSLSFSYLDQADVEVSVNGTIVTNYIFATASSIQFLTAPGAGAAIRIYRETDIDQASATIFPGSAIKAQDLNDNFTQTLYAVQESNFEADSATTTANTALTTANTAISTANAATSTANTALSNSATAVSTANTASTNASNAVTTANTASSNASAAVTTANAATVTANSAASTAATALSTANTASSNASAAVSTANTASTNASNAVTTANTALSTANTASSNASTAVTTANNAVSTANGAVSTANTALSTANAAISAVASAVIYTPVANLTALAALTPSNGDYFELTDSTGAEGSALITGVTVGLVGAPGLTFRLRYDAPPGIFTFLGYFANDSETRYLKLAGGTLTGQLRGDDSTSASTPGFAFDGDPNTGVGRPGADELALITGGTARLTIDPAGAVAVAGSLSQGGNAVVVTTDSRLSDTRVPTDGSVTNTKVAAAAAIDGTKISPNFGSQNVVTTGTVSGASLIPTSSSVPTNGVYLPSANNVAISTNGTGRLFVDSSGRVGVGTSSPSFPLHVAGGRTLCQTGNEDYSLGIARSGSTNAYYLGIHSSTSPNLLFSNNSGAMRMVLTDGGSLGIGTTPDQLLHVKGSNSRIKLQHTVDDAGSVGIEMCNRNSGSSPKAAIMSVATGSAWGVPNLVFYVDGAGDSGSWDTSDERMRIDSSGRLLVGTATVAYNERLSLTRTDTTTNSIVCNIYNSAATSTSKTANALLRVSSNASGADTYINITDNTSFNYNFGGNNGGAYVQANTNGVRLSNGGTSWASDSDERVKDIIEPIENGLDKVGSLRAVIGKYKTDDEDKRRSFLIAQDVQAVLPEAVFDEQGTLMLAYTDTIPLLVTALKESKERIEQLETSNTDLLARVTALEAA